MEATPPDLRAAIAAISAAVAARRITYTKKSLYEIASLRDPDGRQYTTDDATGTLAALQPDWCHKRSPGHKDPTQEVFVFRVPFPGLLRALYVKIALVSQPVGEVFVISFHAWTT